MLQGVLVSVFLFVICPFSGGSELSYLGQKPPGAEPEIFAPGIVSTEQYNHSSVTISPDGREIFWAMGPLDCPRQIYSSKRNAEGWTEARIVPFTKEDDGDCPFLSPDGRTLYFNSNRPVLPGGTRRERYWYAQRTSDGWSEPKPLGLGINGQHLHWQCSVDGEGNFYFGSARAGTKGRDDIFTTKLADGGTGPAPVSLGEAINSDQHEGCPYVAPDGSYMLFARGGLYVSIRKSDGSWSEAANLGETFKKAICPYVSPDGKYLFYLVMGRGFNDVYWVDAGCVKDEISRLNEQEASADAAATAAVSTLLSGSSDEKTLQTAIARDRGGSVYIAFTTPSADLPAERELGSFNGGACDVAVARFDEAVEELLAVRYLGGSYEEMGPAIAVDEAGRVYVAGYTNSRDFPVTAGCLQEEFAGGGSDLFVVCLSGDLTKLHAATFLGGTGGEGTSRNLLLSPDGGEVVVTGLTASADFPVTATGDGSLHKGRTDVFVTLLDSNLARIQASTLIGGAGTDQCFGAAINSKGRIFVAGHTDSADYPTTPGAYRTVHNGDEDDAFVSIFEAGLEDLVASTFIGASSSNGYCLAVDRSGCVYVGGHANPDLPTTEGAFIEEVPRNTGYVAKLNSDLSSLMACTFTKGNVDFLVHDGEGRVHYCGYTNNDFPATATACISTFRGGQTDGFAAAISDDLTNLTDATFLGGGGDDVGSSLVCGEGGCVYVTGKTTSTDFQPLPRASHAKEGVAARFVVRLRLE